LALGSRVHGALEAYYNGTDLLTAYGELLDVDRLIASEEFLDLEGLESEGEMGRIMLEGFLEWSSEEGLDAGYDIISNEETLEMPLPIDYNGEQVVLRGKMDMRVRRKIDGTRLIRDFKTVGQSFEVYSAGLAWDEQALTYLMLEAYHNRDGDRSDGMEFILLKKNKRTARANPPFYDRVEILHNQFELNSFWIRTLGTVTDLINVKKALDAGADHRLVAYPNPSQDWRWKMSEYLPLVQALYDGGPVDEIIEDLYEISDPNARYAEKEASE